MPFLAPLIPALMSIIPEAVGGIGSALGGIATPLLAGDLGGALGGALALPGAVGGALAPGLAGVGTALGIPSAIATPLAGFLSPELIGGGLGYAAGGTKGLEEGLLGGATLGGGLTSLGDLIGTGLNMAGAPGMADAAIGATAGPGSLGMTALNAAGPFIQGAIQGAPSAPVASPSRTITPAPSTTAGVAPPGGPSGLSLTGNTAPQVGPWLSNFWNPQGMNNVGITGSTGNMPMVGSAAPATSSLPSATNQQQLTSP